MSMNIKSLSPNVVDIDPHQEPWAINLRVVTEPTYENMTLLITSEGVIMDFYVNGEMTGTICRTYEEWFDLAQRA
jgi:hypothetical protein